jgi:hypothetical protein
MTTVQVRAKQGEATSTYIVVEQIVRADFYTTEADTAAYAMVHMPDGNTYRVEAEQALALERTLARAQLTI